MKNTLRKALALLLVFSMMFAFSSVSYADDTEGGNTVVKVDKGELLSNGTYQYYKYELDGNTIVEIAKYIGSDVSVNVPSTIDGADVKIIGTEAFYMDPNIEGDEVTKLELTNVVIPDGVEIIGVRAFCNNEKLMTVTIPDSVTEIGSYAFFGCESISSVHMPQNLKSIGDSAFYGCKNFIGNAYIQSEIQNEDGQYADVPALRLPNGMTYLGDNAFTLCESLVWVYIPDGITEICTGTFTNCASLEYVVIPESVESIGAAFNGAYTNHNRLSSYTPKLIIKNPHCKITASPDIDKHVVVYGGKYSAVNAFADEAKCKFETIETPDHVYVGVVTAPKCLEKGYTTYHCQSCEDKGIERDDYYVTDWVDATGHTYGEWFNGIRGRELTEEELKDYVAATCTTGSTKSRTCEDCGYVEIGRVEPTGHHFITRTSATCVKAGYTQTLCEDCGLTTQYIEQPLLGHDWGEDFVVSEWQQCVQDGIIVRTCKREGCVDEDGNQTTIVERTPAHTDANGDNKCDLCGTTVDPVKDCKCYCHAKSGLKALFYKIQLIVWKLFKVEKVCDCGLKHY